MPLNPRHVTRLVGMPLSLAVVAEGVTAPWSFATESKTKIF